MSSLSSSYFLFCLIVVFFFFFFFYCYGAHRDLHSFPTRRSSELLAGAALTVDEHRAIGARDPTDHAEHVRDGRAVPDDRRRSEEHTSELQSPYDLVCRLLLEKKKKQKKNTQQSINNKVYTNQYT